MIHPHDVRRQVGKALLNASQTLEVQLVERLQQALAKDTHVLVSDSTNKRAAASRQLLQAILENLQIAEQRGIPMCQDTGMILACIDVGPDCNLSMHAIECALNEGIADAVANGYFRKSVVSEPLFARTNTQTNLPAIVYWNTVHSGSLTISLMLKGFGCENCSKIVMLDPTASRNDVLKTVVDIVAIASGKPCPPIVVGVGIGGTMDYAAYLSKRALFRPVGRPHPDARYAALESDTLDAIQSLSIGPGGFGGSVTALAVSYEHAPTHIAGMPVAVTISCWADRKGIVVFGGSDGA